MRVLCAIPCFNEEVAIGSVVLRARRHADEVLVVDDGSNDRTEEVARLAGATVVRHRKNQGKGAAYATFWEHALKNGFDALVTLDGDGQHNPDEIPSLLKGLEHGDDLVVGTRWGKRTAMPLWRRAGKRVLDYGTAIAAGGAQRGTPTLTDSQSGFRAYSRRALEAIAPHGAGFSVESQLLIDAHGKGLAIGETPIHCRYDVDGSTLGPVRHASGVLNDLLLQIGIRHPLLFLGLPGSTAALAGLAATGWALIEAQRTGDLRIGLLLGGMLVGVVGVIGLFAGMLFNLLPRIVRREARRER